MELDDEYMAEELTCPRCLTNYKDIFELNSHLSTIHNLSDKERELILNQDGSISLGAGAGLGLGFGASLTATHTINLFSW